MQISITSVNSQKIQKALPKVNAYQSKIGDKTSMTKDKFVNNAVEEYLDKLKENGII